MEHLKYLSWINYAFAALFALIALLALLGVAAAVLVPLAMGGDIDPGALIGPLAGGCMGTAFILLFTLVYAMAGRRVARGQGRILQTILAVLSLGSFPIGTLYAVYALWLCWVNEETKAAFDEPYGIVP